MAKGRRCQNELTSWRGPFSFLSRKRYYVRVAVETSRPNYTEAGQVTYVTREQRSKQPLMCLKQITLQRALTLLKT